MTTLKMRQIYVDDRQKVFVVESIDFRYENHPIASAFLAWSEPVAIIVLNANGAHAIDINAEPVDVDCLLSDVGELDGLLGQ